MSLVSLADLRTQARNRSDMRINGIFTDADFNAAINSSICEINDLIVKSYGDSYFLASASIALQTNVSVYPLPVANSSSGSTQQGMYKLVGVDWQMTQGAPWLTLKPYEFRDRNKQGNVTPYASPSGCSMRYCLYGTNISLLPAPQSGQQLQVWYVPQPTQLVNDTDTYEFQGGWSEFVILGAAIKALAAEESDTTVFERQKMEVRQRIEEMAPCRDVTEPHTMVDVERCQGGMW